MHENNFHPHIFHDFNEIKCDKFFFVAHCYFYQQTKHLRLFCVNKCVNCLFLHWKDASFCSGWSIMLHLYFLSSSWWVFESLSFYRCIESRYYIENWHNLCGKALLNTKKNEKLVVRRTQNPLELQTKNRIRLYDFKCPNKQNEKKNSNGKFVLKVYRGGERTLFLVLERKF